MPPLLEIILFIAGYLLLTMWLLPRLGFSS